MQLISSLVAAASLLGASAMASPIPRDTSVNIELMSLRSASPIHFGSVNAYEGKFYIWGPISTYCPPYVPDCSLYPGNETVITVDNTTGYASMVSLDQFVFIPFYLHEANTLLCSTLLSLVDKPSTLQKMLLSPSRSRTRVT